MAIQRESKITLKDLIQWAVLLVAFTTFLNSQKAATAAANLATEVNNQTLKRVEQLLDVHGGRITKLETEMEVAEKERVAFEKGKAEGRKGSG